VCTGGHNNGDQKTKPRAGLDLLLVFILPKNFESCQGFGTNIPALAHMIICGRWNMSEEKKDKKAQDKIILPEKLQAEMMEFFLRTSIPRKKRQEQEQARLSKTNDRSEK